jgi:hypothetical protein
MHSRLCSSCSSAAVVVVVGGVNRQAGHSTSASGVFASWPRRLHLASANYTSSKTRSMGAFSSSSHTTLSLSKNALSSTSTSLSSTPSLSYPTSGYACQMPRSSFSYLSSSSGFISAAGKSLRLSNARRRVVDTERARLGESSRRGLGSTAGMYALYYPPQSDALAPI